MKAKNNLTADINLLFEMGSMRFMERMWRRFLHDDFANNAEHHFRTFWIAMVIAAHEKNVDVGKVAKMVLAHDVAESRVGDVDYVARLYVDRHEEQAAADIFKNTVLAAEFPALINEYEACQTLEAYIAKDADILDVDFELAEQAARGSQLQAKWASNRQFTAQNRLHTQTAKQLFEQLATADPHAWHINAPNRRNSGDWKS